MSGRVLVAYSSKYGSTAEIANAIATTLRVAGVEVDVRRAREVRSLEGWRAVVLGSAVYMARWRRDAMRLLRRRRELTEREVWLFSSGPVGEDKDEPDEQRDRWTKPKRVEQLAAEVKAHEHAVFVGRVSEDAGFLRKRMARTFRPSCATGATGARSRPGQRRSRTRCASYRLDPTPDAMAEVTITTQPGELPAYLAAVSSGGPRPGVFVIHDGAGMSDDLERKVKWLAGDGFCAAPARSTSLSVAESDGSTDRAGPRAMVLVKVDDTTASLSIFIAGDDR